MSTFFELKQLSIWDMPISNGLESTLRIRSKPLERCFALPVAKVVLIGTKNFQSINVMTEKALFFLIVSLFTSLINVYLRKIIFLVSVKLPA